MMIQLILTLKFPERKKIPNERKKNEKKIDCVV